MVAASSFAAEPWVVHRVALDVLSLWAGLAACNAGLDAAEEDNDSLVPLRSRLGEVAALRAVLVDGADVFDDAGKRGMDLLQRALEHWPLSSRAELLLLAAHAAGRLCGSWGTSVGLDFASTVRLWQHCASAVSGESARASDAASLPQLRVAALQALQALLESVTADFDAVESYLDEIVGVAAAAMRVPHALSSAARLSLSCIVRALADIAAQVEVNAACANGESSAVGAAALELTLQYRAAFADHRNDTLTVVCRLVPPLLRLPCARGRAVALLGELEAEVRADPHLGREVQAAQAALDALTPQ